jgi:hypothetical protein
VSDAKLKKEKSSERQTGSLDNVCMRVDTAPAKIKESIKFDHTFPLLLACMWFHSVTETKQSRSVTLRISEQPLGQIRSRVKLTLPERAKWEA